MKLKNINILLFLIGTLYYQPACSQDYDANWVLGYEDTLIESKCGKVVVHHDSTGLSYSPIETSLNFENTMAAISDSTGELLFYTNGCKIANADNEIMENGNNINPGEIHDIVCNKYGYIVPKGAMIIPYPCQKNKYLLFHLGAIFGKNRDFIFNRLYYTIIDMSSKKGKVLNKNIILLEGDIESFAITKHGNGRDWWLIAPEYGTNIYHKFLINCIGINQKVNIRGGFDFPKEICKYSSNSIFNFDGSKFIRYNSSCGLIVFDFNRCSGELSKSVFMSTCKVLDIAGSMIGISPHNKIYCSSPTTSKAIPHFYYNKLYEFDLNKIGISGDIKEVKFPESYYTYSIRPYDFLFYKNGDMYINNSGSSNYFYTLSNSELDTNQVELIKHDKILPVLYTQTFPYFPNYNLSKLNDSPCDSLTLSDIDEINSGELDIYPNPVISRLNIKYNSNLHLKNKIKIISIQGNTLFRLNIDSNSNYTIDLNDLKPGFYFITMTNNNYFITKKILKL